MITHEYARTAKDVVWRRSKLGLRLSAAQIAAIDAFMADAVPERAGESDLACPGRGPARLKIRGKREGPMTHVLRH